LTCRSTVNPEKPSTLISGLSSKIAKINYQRASPVMNRRQSLKKETPSNPPNRGGGYRNRTDDLLLARQAHYTNRWVDIVNKIRWNQRITGVPVKSLIAGCPAQSPSTPYKRNILLPYSYPYLKPTYLVSYRKAFG